MSTATPRSGARTVTHLRGEGAPRAVELVARQSPLAALSSFSAEIILGDLVLRLPDAAPSTIAAIVRELRASC